MSCTVTNRASLPFRLQVLAARYLLPLGSRRLVRGAATRAAPAPLPLCSRRRGASPPRLCCSRCATTQGELGAFPHPAGSCCACMDPTRVHRHEQQRLTYVCALRAILASRQASSADACSFCSMVDLSSVTNMLASTTARLVQRQQQAAASVASSVPSPQSSNSPPAPKGVDSDAVECRLNWLRMSSSASANNT